MSAKQENYTITFTESELKLLLNALGKRPFEEVYQVIEKIVDSTQTNQSTKMPALKKGTVK